jgi:VWFA-related protein
LQHPLKSALLIAAVGVASFACPEAPAPRSETQAPDSSNSSSRQQAANTLRVLVVDKTGQPVTDLKAVDPRICANKLDRKILSVSPTTDAPKTIGIFFDDSGSRRSDRLLEKEVQLTSDFLQSVWHRGDVGFLVVFNDRPTTIVKPTDDVQELLLGVRDVPSASYQGSTALYDALASVRISGGQIGRGDKLYLVVSDFEDNASRRTREPMIKMLKEQNVRVFPLLREEESKRAHSLELSRRAAKETAEKTGGEVLQIECEKDLEVAFQRLTNDLRGSYVVEFEPLPAGADKKASRSNPRGQTLNCSTLGTSFSIHRSRDCIGDPLLLREGSLPSPFHVRRRPL